MIKQVMILVGAGQIGMAIARRMGYGMKIVVGDYKMENAEVVTRTMTDAGFDATPFAMDLSSRDSIRIMIAEAQRHGEIANVAELLLTNRGAFTTGADFLVDGGATAAFFYGPLKPEE